MLTQKQIIEELFKTLDINSPVKEVVNQAKKSYGRKISPNLVSTIRQQILKNSIIVEKSPYELRELIKFGQFVREMGGLEKVKGLIKTAEEIVVNW